MKRVIIVSLIVFGLALVGCKLEPELEPDKFIGTWLSQATPGAYKLIFHNDHEFTPLANIYHTTTKGTYTYTRNKITFDGIWHIDGSPNDVGKSYKETHTYYFKNNYNRLRIEMNTDDNKHNGIRIFGGGFYDKQQ